ncbi:hypothetical protein ACT3J6_23465, partial [Mycobacterium tuberculosis]
PAFPLLLYYNQVLGSLVKIRASFYLDQQSWTRQKTQLKRGYDRFQTRFNRHSSTVFSLAAWCLFAAFVMAVVSAP